ncbi:MAG: alpha/beta hydrolase [Sphingomonas sp.]
MRFWIWAALCAALFSGTASAQTLPASATASTPEMLRQFAGPHDRVDIGGGRRINLFCVGQGKRTVLFDAGGSDWSVIWGLVQPAVAAGARSCSYDRAGLGHSDPARGPRTPMAIVEDMHVLIHAAKLSTPLVLVGHSLGGFNVKLYAAIYPEDVAALVLVDPAEDRWYDRIRPEFVAKFGPSIAARNELGDQDFFRALTAHYEQCAISAREHDLDPASETYRRCTDPVRAPLGPDIAAERLRIQVTYAYQNAQASEVGNSVYGNPGANGSYALLFRGQPFGTRPVIVLSHCIFDADDPLDVASFWTATRLHAQSAGLSRRGRHIIVPGTHHNIEIDAPDAIIAAIGQVLAQLDRGR